METAGIHLKGRLIGSAATALLFIMYSAYPAAKMIGQSFFEADVLLSSYIICALILFFCSAAASAVTFRAGEVKSRTIRAFAALLPGLSFLNILMYSEGFPESEPYLNLLMVFLLFLGTAACVMIRIRALYSDRIRHWSWIVPLAVSVPLGFICFIGSIFGAIGSDTTVQSLVSPDGRNIAELIDADEGALGGSTLVTVRPNFEGGFLVFRWAGISSTVYSGEWGEFNDIDIEWQDDETLLINGKKYRIK